MNNLKRVANNGIGIGRYNFSAYVINSKARSVSNPRKVSVGVIRNTIIIVYVMPGWCENFLRVSFSSV